MYYNASALSGYLSRCEARRTYRVDLAVAHVAQADVKADAAAALEAACLEGHLTCLLQDDGRPLVVGASLEAKRYPRKLHARAQCVWAQRSTSP